MSKRLNRIARLLSVQGDHCVYCGDKFAFDTDDSFPTIDHVVPLARGGANCSPNLALACHRCNQQKGNRSADEFRQIIANGGLRPRGLMSNIMREQLAEFRQRFFPPGPKLGDVRGWDEDRFAHRE